MWYRWFPPHPPRGKGTRDHPMTLDDLTTLFKALDRTGWYDR
jgi:hypothetical protein